MKKPAALPFSESALQAQLCNYLDLSIKPGLHWFAIENGGHRNLLTAVRLKRTGVRRGSPDLCFLLPEGRVAWLELKIKGGSLSPPQREFRDTARRLGHHWAVARTLDEAIAYLGALGVLKITQANQTKQKEKASERA